MITKINYINIQKNSFCKNYAIKNLLQSFLKIAYVEGPHNKNHFKKPLHQGDMQFHKVSFAMALSELAMVNHSLSEMEAQQYAVHPIKKN